MLAAHGVSLESIAESLLFENLSNEKKPFLPCVFLGEESPEQIRPN